MYCMIAKNIKHGIKNVAAKEKTNQKQCNLKIPNSEKIRRSAN